MEFISIEKEAFKKIYQMLVEIYEFIHNTTESKTVTDNEDILLTETDICQGLGISQRTIRRYRMNGEIEYIQIKRKFFYKIEAIRQFLSSHQFKSANENIEELIESKRRILNKKLRFSEQIK